MNHWLLVLLLCQTVTWSVRARCLTNTTGSHRINFFHYPGSVKPAPLTIESSSRITHSISSNIFRIFLEEVLGYGDIHIVHRDDGYNSSSALDRVSLVEDEYTENWIEPSVMINLEVPADFDFTVTTAGRLEAYEAGLIAPFGRFGWYVSNKQNLSWESFRDPQPDYKLSVAELAVAKNISRKIIDCDHEHCSDGYYQPYLCRSRTCATLLAEDFNSTKVVMDQIVQLGLLVEVVWLGSDLPEFLKTRTSPSLVLAWYPGPVTVSGDWQPVYIRPCWNNLTAPECFYAPRRLVKLVSTRVRDGASSAFHSLSFLSFSRREHEDLVRLALEHPTKSHYDIACDWMQKNHSIWNEWNSEASPKTELTICGIFPILDYPPPWRTIPNAADMAVKEINNNSNILNSYILKLSHHNGQCNSDMVTNIFIDYVLSSKSGDLRRMVGILGPACSDTVEPLVGITKYFRTVVISYSAEGALFSDKEKQPFFFRTIGENQQFKQVYLKLLKRMGWKRMAALTEDGQKYTEYLSHLQDLLQANNLTFITHRKFPRNRVNATMRTYLEDLQSRRARIIVADVYDAAARSVMCEAYHLKMTAADGYVWFLPQWLAIDWYNTTKYTKEKVDCTTEQMRQAIDGHFSLAHEYFAPDHVKTDQNITVGDFKKAFMNTTKNVSNYGGYAYDAVWMYAFALDKLRRANDRYLSNIHSQEASQKFMEYLQATDFMGVSGRINFRSGSSSRITNVNILQWINGTFNHVGTALYNMSDTSEKLDYRLDLNVSKIKWLTEDHQQPSDGEEMPPTCMLQGLAEFLGVSCNSAIVIANVIGFACLAVLLVGAVAITKRRYDRRVEELEKADRFIKSMGIDLLPNLSDLDKWEIPRDRVVINRRLGEGAFGTVYGGEAFFQDEGWVAAAVKTLKVNSTTEVKLDFLSEAEVMKRFDHKNIVKLLGVCTRDEPVYTVMEFMLYGDLKTFLLNRRHLVTGRRMPDESNEVSNKKLTGMALDIARGLSYLASLKYVHRDIACRNCLLNSARVAKIGDFGLTRRMYESDYYKFTRKGMMPVRWMAPECLADGIFTTKSDVWSFGVVLYEIVTFGSYPYQGLSNNEVMDHVKAGNTIEIPKNVKPQLECLMKLCWTQDYKKRPEITEIVVFLANNPRLLAPCLEGPTSSVAVDDTELLQGRPSVPASPFDPANNFFRGNSMFELGERTTPPASPTELGPSSGFFSDNVREQLLPSSHPVGIAMQRLAPLASRTPSDIDLQSGLL